MCYLRGCCECSNLHPDFDSNRDLLECIHGASQGERIHKQGHGDGIREASGGRNHGIVHDDSVHAVRTPRH
jgi:hypothetical protein